MEKKDFEKIEKVVEVVCYDVMFEVYSFVREYGIIVVIEFDGVIVEILFLIDI